MTFEDVAKIVLTVIASLGGGGAIVVALSSWLGKVWANRLMAAEQAKHSQDLEKLRAELTQANQILLEAERAKFSRELEEWKAQLIRTNEENLSKLKSDLEIQRHSQIKEYQDKLDIYRKVGDIVSDLLADFDVYKGNLPPEQVDKFNRRWMKAYGELGMLGPQDVMDSFDRLNDYLLGLITGNETYEWSKIRELSLGFINSIRNDVGIDKSSIEYRGDL
jgi:hypothetical protein